MARKKNSNIEGQGNLFDWIEQIEQLQAENEQENKILEEALYAHTTNETFGNSTQISDRKNNQATLWDRRENDKSLLDFGQMGIEQPRETIGSTGGGFNSLDTKIDEPMEVGRGRDEHGGILQHGTGRHEQVGDIQDYGYQHRTGIAKNYTITAEDNLGKGGAKSKFRDNIEAIKVLNNLRKNESKLATEEEQKILAKYVGWGGLAQAFDESNEQWQKEFTELKELLSPSDYTEARRSTQDAHFTSETIIKGMYQGLARLGVNQSTEHLQILEPSAGIGNFIGLKPETFKADFYTVEQDSTSADILKYLYPEEVNKQSGFQNMNFGSSIFDVALGNPPFGNQKLFDKNHQKASEFSIHNYFIAKSMDLVKEGGVGAFVVSRHFMDSHTRSHRDYIGEKSHFLGAVRLPNNAFQENALTDVTTDIVFFQKKTQHEIDNNIEKGEKWLSLEHKFFDVKNSTEQKNGFINEYFINNPEQVLGNMQFVCTQFGEDLKCLPLDNYILEMGILNGIQKLPRAIFDKNIVQKLDEQADDILKQSIIDSEYYKELKPGSFLNIHGRQEIGIKEEDDFTNDTITKVSLRNTSAYHRLAGMIEIRDTLRTLLNLEKNFQEHEDIEKTRKKLNVKYDHYTKKYGLLHSQVNRSLMRDDPESALILSLENDYKQGISKEFAQKSGTEAREPSAKKAAIFSRRVLEFATPATSADSALDALSISLRESGKIDFERMASLLDKPQDDIQQELQENNLIFHNPENQEWEIKDKYLTGNIRHKLRVAEKQAEENPQYQVNLEALKEVMPKDIEAVDIGVKFGSTWLPKEVILEFVEEKIGGVHPYQKEIDYLPVLGKWNVNLKIYDRSINNELWGTPEYPAEDLIKSLLVNRPIKVEKEVGRDQNNKPIMQVDQEATAVAMQKANDIQQAFSDWIWEDDTRREKLTKIYNERFNTHVTPHYDGSHIELSGASANVELRTHQKDVVWRSIQEGTALFDHVVGAGKTLATIATIKESKRMGFVKKPMVAVPNHLLYQWKDEFYKLYPDANILVAEKTDFLKENREKFFSKVATGEWDAVIVAHSSFKKIDMPKEVQEEIFQEQIDAVENALITVKENEGSRATVKQLEKQKEKMLEKFRELTEKNNTKDTSVDFADLGVDALFVDEAHEFKNLSFATSMNVSGLGNVSGSAKAFDLFVKCRYLQKQHEGKGVYFLTGTPISNTIAEVYTMQKYMQYDELKAKNIEHFDSWASTFGKVSANWELDATGVNYKLKSRFANFENVPELLSMYRTFADVVTKQDIDIQREKEGKTSLTPRVKGGKPTNHVVERSGDQAVYMDDIIDRMENLPPNPSLDNPLKITNDARKAGLDYRLIDPSAEDFHNSKVNLCADKIYENWLASREDKGTQLVFCDLSTPKKAFEERVEVKAENIVFDDNSTEKEDDDQIDMDSIIAGITKGDFSVYNDLKQKLIDKGIPKEEIVFIHEANTDQRKAKLFGDVNRGDVRVLIGSTSKMGSGMNVQERLVAAHHLDAPWRPSDLEQRNGRIIRQGNKLHERDPNFEVEINYYATKQTYDARMWQTIEYKAAAIEQFRKGDVLQRTIEDVQSEASNAAEMKAAASGNPLILMEVNFNTEKRKLEALQAQHNRSKHRLADNIKYLKGSDERMRKAETSYQENTSLRDRNTKKIIVDDKEKIKLELYTKDRMLTADNIKDLQNLFVSCANQAINSRNKKIDFGNYRGFDVTVRYCPTIAKEGYRFFLENEQGIEFSSSNLSYAHDDKISISGFFQRVDNFLEKEFDIRLTQARNIHAREKAELPSAEQALNKPFAQADELKLVRDNHNSVLLELKRIQEDTAYVSEWKPKSLEDLKREKKILKNNEIER